jgi:DNA-binding GntR family transcriptional regulator
MERKQGYGWRFLPVAKTPEALTQIYRFRSIIEPAAFMEDTFQLDWPTLNKLKGIQESLLRSEIVNLPADRLATINSQFHEELIRMSGNLFMHQALMRLNRTRRLLEYRSMIDRSRIYKQCEEHLAIVELLGRGANLEASYFMRTHLIGALAGKLASSQVVADDAPEDHRLAQD